MKCTAIFCSVSILALSTLPAAAMATQHTAVLPKVGLTADKPIELEIQQCMKMHMYLDGEAVLAAFCATKIFVINKSNHNQQNRNCYQLKLVYIFHDIAKQCFIFALQCSNHELISTVISCNL